MLVSKTMPNTTTETPDWLREMETILEELSEGVVVVDDQLRVVFANEALTRSPWGPRPSMKADITRLHKPDILTLCRQGPTQDQHRTLLHTPRSGRILAPAQSRRLFLCTGAKNQV